MVKLISCVNSHCGNRCKALSTQNTCLVNIILLVAELFPDNWHCFSFWHQVFPSGDFLLFVAHFSMLLDSLHVQGRGLLRHTELEPMIGGSLHMQSLHAQCVSGILEIRWVHLPPTSQALRCDYCAHIHCDDDAQPIYRAALVDIPVHDSLEDNQL